MLPPENLTYSDWNMNDWLKVVPIFTFVIGMLCYQSIRKLSTDTISFLISTKNCFYWIVFLYDVIDLYHAPLYLYKQWLHENSSDSQCTAMKNKYFPNIPLLQNELYFVSWHSQMEWKSSDYRIFCFAHFLKIPIIV